MLRESQLLGGVMTSNGTIVSGMQESALRALKTLLGARATTNDVERDHRSHGESYHSSGLPDVVCFPQSAEEVSEIVKITALYGLPVVPFGAGTSLEGHDGEAISVMVLNAAYMEVLVAAETPENAALREQMIYTMAHECGHVHDLDVRATSMPDIILKQRLSFRDGILFGIASGCWDEYMACHLSAFIARESALRPLEDTFCAALERARDRANAAIRQYRMHSDVSGVTKEVSEIYKRVMVYGAYMVGHIDGIEGEVWRSSRSNGCVRSTAIFQASFSRLCDELRAMHGTYGQWKGLEIYEPLKQLADELLKASGIGIQPRADDGAYVHIPFSAETMPTLEEQMAFLATKSSGGRK